MQLGGILNRLRRESAKKNGRQRDDNHPQQKKSDESLDQPLENSSNPSEALNIVPEAQKHQEETPLAPPEAKRPKLSESLEARKNSLLSTLEQNLSQNIQKLAPVIPSPSPSARVAQPSPAASSNVYVDLLDHFENNPDELREFASRIVLDSLRFMRDRAASKIQTFEAPAAVLARADDIEASNTSNAMDVDTHQDNQAPAEATPAMESSSSVSLLQKASAEYSGDSNKFLKGVKWSPDGNTLLSACEDNCIRLYDTSYSYYLFNKPEDDDAIRKSAFESVAAPRLTIQEAEAIYDYAWYPYSYSSMPGSSVFLCTTRDHPIHLWDAETGALRATYRAYDHNDEISSSFSVSFSPDGQKIFGGYNGMIRMFDISTPGRDCVNFITVTQKGNARFIPRNMQLKGIISSFSFTQDASIIAAGSYSGNVGLYGGDGLEPIGMLYDAHPNGVSQVLFSQDGNYLYTGGRKDDYIHCWDVRNTMQVVFSISRRVENNQRIAFSIDHSGRYLASGLQNGKLQIYDLYARGAIVVDKSAHGDAVNAASFHPYLNLIATSSGQRHFDSDSSASSEDEDEDAAGAANASAHSMNHDFSVSIWKTMFQSTE